MVTKLMHVVYNKWLLALHLLSIGVFLAVYLWPSSYWFVVREVYVETAAVGDDVIMKVDRTIKRPFYGLWTTTLRRLNGSGWVVWCRSGGALDYKVDSAFPEPLTLRWWTYPNCNPLDAGTYRIETSWVIDGGRFLPDKRVSNQSNNFEIK